MLLTKELRAMELAISRTLQSDFYMADQVEIDAFVNSWRGFWAGRVRVEEGDHEPVIVEFPAALAFSDKTQKIKASAACKLNEDDVVFIKKNKGLMPQTELAKKYKVTEQTIWGIHSGRTWIDVQVPIDLPNPISKPQIHLTRMDA